MNDLIVIGRTAAADFPVEGIKGVPVKIDTGADSSSIWASELHMDDDATLHFVLFGKGSPHYSGKVHSTKSYEARLIRSSHGTTQIRYRVQISMVLEGHRLRARMTLADRSLNTYPVLIGCKTLQNRFLVDVSQGKRSKDNLESQSNALNDELHKDPKAFFNKYHIANHRGDITL